MAKQQPIYGTQGEQALMRELWDSRLANNPREFVRFVYPWGKPGTPLEFEKGPRNWQDQVLKDIGDYYAKAKDHENVHHSQPDMFKAAIASGRGIGKSATFGWLAHWMVTTRLGSSVWVAANGEPQLKTKTFPEISKWVAMSINAHWFEIMATKIEMAEWLTTAVLRDLKINKDYWYISAQLWSAENPDAFAGAHNAQGEMALFDEASGIPANIWPVQAGVFTEKTVDRYWLAFSNPRNPEGGFYECFNANRRFWRTYQIDSRTVDIAQDGVNSIIEQFGPDSREAKVEVYGEFPSHGEDMFINRKHAADAATREVYPDPGAPLLIGVDVARFGDDDTVICFRKGRDARSIPWLRGNGWSTTQTAAKVAEVAGNMKPAAIFVDGGGVGGGVVDQLKGWGYRVVEVQSGESASDKVKYANKRVEMWDKMREWLPTAMVPAGKDMEQDLCTTRYGYTPTNQLKLESKTDMKKRGDHSPDLADALALTFAQPVARQDERHSRYNPNGPRNRQARDVDYDMFAS